MAGDTISISNEHRETISCRYLQISVQYCANVFSYILSFAFLFDERRNIRGEEYNLLTSKGGNVILMHVFRTDLDKLTFAVSLEIPVLIFEGEYEVNINFLVVPIKARGPLHGNTSEYKSMQEGSHFPPLHDRVSTAILFVQRM